MGGTRTLVTLGALLLFLAGSAAAGPVVCNQVVCVSTSDRDGDGEDDSYVVSHGSHHTALNLWLRPEGHTFAYAEALAPDEHDEHVLTTAFLDANTTGEDTTLRSANASLSVSSFHPEDAHYHDVAWVWLRLDDPDEDGLATNATLESWTVLDEA